MQPARLPAAGYQFRFPVLTEALLHETHCLKAGPALVAVNRAAAMGTTEEER
jgi:hypothetical protein